MWLKWDSWGCGYLWLGLSDESNEIPAPGASLVSTGSGWTLSSYFPGLSTSSLRATLFNFPWRVRIKLLNLVKSSKGEGKKKKKIRMKKIKFPILNQQIISFCRLSLLKLSFYTTQSTSKLFDVSGYMSDCSFRMFQVIKICLKVRKTETYFQIKSWWTIYLLRTS